EIFMKLLEPINSFKDQSIIVIGDTMVDEFIWGAVKRISPEAPVPVVEVLRQTQTLGGAGNVAANIASFGGKAFLISSIGADIEAQSLKSLLAQKNISSKYVVEDPSKPTIIKTRIIASSQHVCRVDKEIKGALAGGIEANIIENLQKAIDFATGIIISDYGKGVVSNGVLKEAIALAHKKNIPITVDPKLDNFEKYKGITTITPNTKEAIEGMHAKNIDTDEELAVLGKEILNLLNSASVLITRSEKGMMLIEPNKITNIPTRAKEDYDVTGAGDTVISTLTLALASGADFLAASEIANFAAGIVVGKLGTATTTITELQAAVEDFYK
ncbi:MAG: D-glycero-beta-D-manno-heptose-7-phosphate kinase, partial [Elusimicrobiota bacterium]|nr:D-glycero-beta-D-manno-heptose-7-phosphate kinase [Elusimicrobiota bacterium]